ncbi:MAG: cobalamin B12-binding domain-containing protein [Bacteroidetes bacterium]|nr:cobalamin B12-binding domain-containing protein [Bacteroidota bacterium]
MNELLQQLSVAVESGKINKASPFPPSMKGMDGADELCQQALEVGIKAETILNDALITGMARIGQKFSEGKAYVPEMLIAAKAMTAAMKHIKPYFTSGEIKRKGTIVIGTVHGDLHDIGKNIVAMTIEGAGWEVIDLGVDVNSEKFINAIEKYPDCVIGMSALLTTTMANMESTVKELKSKYPNNKVIVGGAPLSMDFCQKIGADFYSPSPQGAAEYLKTIVC